MIMTRRDQCAANDKRENKETNIKYRVNSNSYSEAHKSARNGDGLHSA